MPYLAIPILKILDPPLKHESITVILIVVKTKKACEGSYLCCELEFI